MSLLIISDYCSAIERSPLLRVSDCLRRRIEETREAQGSVCFVQSRHGAGFEALGIGIGRYDPVFSAFDLFGRFPTGLIDFIVANVADRIELAGIAPSALFDRYRNILDRSGYETRLCSNAILPIELAAKRQV